MKNFNDDNYYNQALFETSNFKVIPSLGSLVEGWLLIIPKKHFISIRAINNSKLYSELESLTKQVLDILKFEYGEVILFEHGPVESNKLVGCGVDYAHLHLVPSRFNLIDGIKKYYNYNYKWEKVSSIENTPKHKDKEQAYLYIQDQFSNSFITYSDNIPSQLFRKVIANELGTPEDFDWKENHNVENIKKTILRLSKYAQKINKVNVEIYQV